MLRSELRAIPLNVTQWKDVWRRFSRRGTCAPELAALLLLPLRRLVLSPKSLVRHLVEQRVTERGPGAHPLTGSISIDGGAQRDHQRLRCFSSRYYEHRARRLLDRD